MTFVSGNRALRRAQFLQATKHLLNGNYKHGGCVEHWCRAPGCCSNEAHTLAQFNSLFVEKLEPPAVWRESRWLGVLQPTDVLGYVYSVHNMFEPVFMATCS